ncbi:hypothetical protein ADIS_3995 [Lunatimonas lonarensis]|uniref:Uncharacterized protein n=1 Tax=Lunatimonas lonarensis TaxID=1232681 RepID=R7ZNF1_9BACT|nr:hypothetical protein ADIS_3995 [Lunatimonas lonarensis]
MREKDFLRKQPVNDWLLFFCACFKVVGFKEIYVYISTLPV